MAKKLYRIKDMPWLIIEMEEIINQSVKETTKFSEFDYTKYMDRWKNIKSNYPINLINK